MRGKGSWRGPSGNLPSLVDNRWASQLTVLRSGWSAELQPLTAKAFIFMPSHFSPSLVLLNIQVFFLFFSFLAGAAASYQVPSPGASAGSCRPSPFVWDGVCPVQFCHALSHHVLALSRRRPGISALRRVRCPDDGGPPLARIAMCIAAAGAESRVSSETWRLLYAVHKLALRVRHACHLQRSVFYASVTLTRSSHCNSVRLPGNSHRSAT